jgi:hypothetical protein
MRAKRLNLLQRPRDSNAGHKLINLKLPKVMAVLMSFFSASLMLQAEAAGTPLRGVWQGALGDQAIVACFNGTADGNQTGNYYYVRHKQPMQLVLVANQDAWSESPDDTEASQREITGHWKLGQPDNNGVKGSWTSVKGNRSLPIALKPLNGTDVVGACGGDAYNAPLETMPAVAVGKVQEINHHPYRTLHVADVEVLELLEHGPVIERLNARFRAMLPKSKADLQQYFQTRRRFLVEEGTAVSDEVEASVTVWNDKWLTVQDYRWTAGTGRQGISSSFTTWNLATGDKIDVWQWLGQKSSEEGDVAALPSAFASWLDTTYPPDADCKDASYESKGYFHMQLESGGLHLYEDAYGNGCERDYTVPYKEIRRFLTPAGNAALSALLDQHK